MILRELTTLIDTTVEKAKGTPRNPDQGLRHHLGASIIGRKCSREIYYSYRWATPSQFDGRMLRLFDRGHEEEFRFADWLRLVGATVETIDPKTKHKLFYHGDSDSYFTIAPGETISDNAAMHCDDVSDVDWHIIRATGKGVEIPKPRQYGFKDATGHFAGSHDAHITNLPYVNLLDLSPLATLLGEFKTHNEKSFKNLVEVGVKEAKPEHHVQMVTYMYEDNLPAGLYCAVNKNTEHLHFEFVLRDDTLANNMKARAYHIIFAERPPPRISTSPVWFDCKYCDHKPICHYGAPMAKNCRTCKSSRPVANGEWACAQWNCIIPKEAQPLGCDAWKQITD